ncbi:MAG: hypothetical protein D6800_00070 [Candidatus Zixiibacteriota bacterium]|nr:MAG: hypothetical protein D6800_00070 [candidate division Zixibacteria bacterium]
MEQDDEVGVKAVGTAKSVLACVPKELRLGFFTTSGLEAMGEMVKKENSVSIIVSALSFVGAACLVYDDPLSDPDVREMLKILDLKEQTLRAMLKDSGESFLGYTPENVAGLVLNQPTALLVGAYLVLGVWHALRQATMDGQGKS